MDKIIKQDVESILNDVDFSLFNGKNILIAGVSGMLGTYILFCLKEYNEKCNAGITMYAIIHRDLPPHLSDIANCDFIHIIKGDMADADFCNKLPTADFIFHAACYAQPSKFTQDIKNTITLNTLTTSLLLEKLKESGTFLFFSSVAVYVGYDGKSNENADVYNIRKDGDIRECYYRSKKAGEYICNSYSLLPNKSAKIVRIGLTYGPGTRSDDGKALSDFISKGKSGKIEMRDSGIDLQHYCYISDMIRQLFQVLLFGKENLYNIGSPDRVSIKEVAETVGSIMNAEIIVPNKQGKQITALTDVSRIMKEFPNDSFVNLHEGIKRTIEWKKIWKHI